MLKVVEVIGLASTGAYEGDASRVTRTKIVRIASLGSGRLPQSGLCRREGNTAPAEHEGVTNAYVCRLLHSLAAPEIVEAILDGRQPKGPTLAEMRWNRPVVCEEQRKVWLCFWSVGGLKLEHHHPSWVIHSHRLVLEALAARSPRKRPHLQLRRFHVRL